MARTPAYAQADLVLQGQLAEYMAAARSRDESFEDIAFALRTDHSLIVSAATVRRWAIELGLFTPEARATA